MSFSPPSAAPYTINSLPLFSFQVTQSLHCTRGVVITGAAEIGQEKGTLPTQDVFPSFFLNSFLPRLSYFPFSSHVIHFSHSVFFYLLHFSLISSISCPINLVIHQIRLFSTFFKVAQILFLWLNGIKILPSTPTERLQVGSVQKKGVGSAICSRIEKMCLFLIMRVSQPLSFGDW